MSKNIVFVDSRVSGYETLIASLSADSEWYCWMPHMIVLSRCSACRNALDSIHESH